MKHITILTTAASLLLAAFFIALAAGYASLTVFLVAATAWVVLLTVNAYTPQERTWLPKLASERMLAEARANKPACLPLAA